MPIHLHPTAPLAERVLLPGDPGRALRLAQWLLGDPKMFNHNRGLWGYTGAAADGEPLSIQSTGMGGPSAAIVVSELVELGARRLVRVGTCGALDPGFALGDLIVAEAAVSADGTSRALGAGDRVPADQPLTRALLASGRARAAVVASTDLFYDERPGLEEGWIAAGASAVEMESATLFTLAERRGVRAGAVLVVSDQLVPTRTRIEPESLEEAERQMGAVAFEALASSTAPAD